MLVLQILLLLAAQAAMVVAVALVPILLQHQTMPILLHSLLQEAAELEVVEHLQTVTTLTLAVVVAF
jgi:predicted lipid carrier protein YhbT